VADTAADILRRLFRVPPNEFVAERNKIAKALKADGEKDLAAAVSAVRRPGVSDWALDVAAAEHADDVAERGEAANEVLDAQEAAMEGRDGGDLRIRLKLLRVCTASVANQASVIAAEAGQTGAGSSATDITSRLTEIAANRNALSLLQRGLLGASSICLYYLGIEGAGAGLATLLHCTYPVWTVLLAGLFLGEAIGANAVGALLLNLCGVFVVIGPGADIGAARSGGAIFALCASVLAGGAVATARHLRASEDASLITTYFMAVGAVLTAPALLAGLPPFSPALSLALLGVVLTSVGGQWLLHHGLGYTTAAQGSLTAATSVLSAALLETAVTGQHLSAHSLLGAALMIAAVGLAVKAPARRAGGLPLDEQTA
jgi:drug/metabolite transporter (DMT)-like permease